MLAYIYHLTNIVNNKKYIGKTIDIEHRLESHFSLLANHKHHSHKLQRAVDKYGLNNFKVSFKQVEVASEQELNLLEIQEIEKYNSYHDGYNETLGGDGNSLLFDFEFRTLIFQICLRYEGVKRQLASFFKCDDSTIASIANNSIYAKIEYEDDKLNQLIEKVGLSDKNLKENYQKHNERKLTQQQIFEILAIITTEQGYDRIMCNLMNVNCSLTVRLKQRKIYKEYIEEYEKLSDEEKEAIKTTVMSKYDLIALKGQLNRKGVINPLTQEQVNYILDNAKTLKRVEIANDLGISADRVSSVILNKSYKDLVLEYYKTHSKN